MKDFFSTVFSFNFFKIFIYFIFVFSGSIKWIPFPIDLTLFFGGLCVIVLFFEIKTITIFRKEVYNQVFLILILLSFFAFSNFYTVSYIYSDKKNEAMFLNFFTVIYPLFAFKNVIFKELQKLMYLVGIFAISMLLYVYFTSTFIIFFDATQYIENVPTYLSIGIMLSACFVFSLSSKPTIAVIAYRLVLLFLLTQLGGRGPIFNLILSLCIYYMLNLKNLKFNYKVILTFMAAILVVIFYLDNIIDLIIENVNVDRFNMVKASSEDGSVLYRVMVMKRGLETFYEHPFLGLGIGSSGIALTGEDQVEFPHNLIVESLMELGIMGGVLYLGIYIYFFVYHLKYIRKDKKILIIYIVSLLFFLEDMKSGSFDGWRISLFWVSIYLVEYNFKMNNAKNSKQHLTKT
ncbi:O-antigen ligase family protein [Chryseobacterium sp. OV279]|uniref:O-antigen ligase family protein n=1 Tax=Chryseobacterium sp. OV279 TaxID=1500285 RepID=UPI0006472A9C|nr:O-antigen ligase family protein [Chryseobacterium sp. OV279]SHE73955.1 O-antigen ligase [Chryseobacterium sp. OV279]